MSRSRSSSSSCSSFWLAALLIAIAAAPILADESIEEYGPPNLLKSTPTPFGVGNTSPGEDTPGFDARPQASRLTRRLVPQRVYLPGRLVLGKPAEFVIKARPGAHVAVAMADKNVGARPIYGQDIRLGPDRKVVTLGTIPETGVLSLFIETPIQGDMIGQHLYFETVIWTRPDFSDLEIATPVKSEIGDDDPEHLNGVIVAPDVEPKKGIRITPATTLPLHYKNAGQGLDSGRP